jgi:hypothetical protein
MHDAAPAIAGAAVGVMQGMTTLRSDERGDQRRHATTATARQGGAKIPSIDVLHGQKHVIADATEVEHRHDVLLHQSHRQLRFLDKQIEKSRIGDALAPQPLDDQAFLDAGHPTTRQVHFGHPTASQRTQQLVPAKHAHA